MHVRVHVRACVCGWQRCRVSLEGCVAVTCSFIRQTGVLTRYYRGGGVPGQPSSPTGSGDLPRVPVPKPPPPANTPSKRKRKRARGSEKGLVSQCATERSETLCATAIGPRGLPTHAARVREMHRPGIPSPSGRKPNRTDSDCAQRGDHSTQTRARPPGGG